RVLLAPSRRIADFVAATYRFDRIEVVPVSVTADAPAAVRTGAGDAPGQLWPKRRWCLRATSAGLPWACD
ncbi:hypothetical protein ACFCYO_36735, partial [Streptomyces sp. NPDC056308]